MGTTSEVSNNFAEMIRAARERRGWSQEALAEAAGVSQSTIDKIERGLTKRSRFLHAIANVLDLSLDEIDPNSRDSTHLFEAKLFRILEQFVMLKQAGPEFVTLRPGKPDFSSD